AGRHFGAGIACPPHLKCTNGDRSSSPHHWRGLFRGSLAFSLALSPPNRFPMLSLHLSDLGLDLSGHSLCGGNDSSALHRWPAASQRRPDSPRVVPREAPASKLGASPR